MPSKWIDHVKKYAADNKMSYRDALKCAKCKASYKSDGKGVQPIKNKQPKNPTKPIGLPKPKIIMESGAGLRAIARKMHGKGNKSSKIVPIKSEPEPEEPMLSPSLTHSQLRNILNVLYYERNDKEIELGSLRTFPRPDRKKIKQLEAEIDFISKQEDDIKKMLETTEGGRMGASQEQDDSSGRQAIVPNEQDIFQVENVRNNLIQAIEQNIESNTGIYNAMNYGLILRPAEIQNLRRVHDTLNNIYEQLISMSNVFESQEDIIVRRRRLNRIAQLINRELRLVLPLQRVYDEFLNYIEEREQEEEPQGPAGQGMCGGKIPVKKPLQAVVYDESGRPLTQQELLIREQNQRQLQRQRQARERQNEARERVNMRIEDRNALNNIDINSELMRLQSMMDLLQNYALPRTQGRGLLDNMGEYEGGKIKGGAIKLKEFIELPNDIINEILNKLTYSDLMNLHNSLDDVNQEGLDPTKIQILRDLIVNRIERLRSKSPPTHSGIRQRSPSPPQKNKKQRTSPLREIEMPDFAFAFAAPAPPTPTSTSSNETSGGKIHKNANSYVQSLVFDKSKFDKKTASDWLKKNNYENKGADMKDNTIRYRQVNPQYIEKMGFNRFRTKKIGRNSGISLILAYK